MDVKIKCTKDEFAQLVRCCACAEIGDYCHSCMFYDLSRSEDGCAGIEHIADCEIVEDGAAHG